ncbi:unnamed protein product [Mytilus edulis]|uniref:Retrotransposon gag domain-containing protein n=1 Tax=Mytilus edulis TaxID=6550 RepID=A0A8S3UI09_MYTED|nr:unnamed protein product [Mytilus edulis]
MPAPLNSYLLRSQDTIRPEARVHQKATETTASTSTASTPTVPVLLTENTSTNLPPPPPPVHNRPPFLPLHVVPVQQPPVQATATGQSKHRPAPPGCNNSKIMVNLKHYNGDTDTVQWWASFLVYITLQRMTEWDVILVLPFYLCGIAKQWFEMIDSTTTSSLANIQASFLNRFKQHKQEDIGLTYLRQQENEPVDQYLHRVLNYNKTNSVSTIFG